MAQSGTEYAEQLEYAAQRRAKSRSLKPLRALLPFLKPYGWVMVGAFLAMVVAAAATLVAGAVRTPAG